MKARPATAAAQAASAASHDELGAPERRRLEREWRVFARLLGGRRFDPEGAPGRDLGARYVHAHALGAVQPPRGVRPFDRACCALARGGTWAARGVDAHAALLDRRGYLRHKLVLVLALLESRGPTDTLVDRVERGTQLGFLASGLARAIGFGLSFALGLLPLLALRAACACLRAPLDAPAPGAGARA